MTKKLLLISLFLLLNIGLSVSAETEVWKGAGTLTLPDGKKHFVSDISEVIFTPQQIKSYMQRVISVLKKPSVYSTLGIAGTAIIATIIAKKTQFFKKFKKKVKTTKISKGKAVIVGPTPVK